MQKIITIENKEITISTVPLIKLPYLIKQLENLPKILLSISGKSNEEIMGLLPTLISDFLPDVIKIVVFATDLTEEEVGQMGAVDVYDVLLGIVEVNRLEEIFKRLKKNQQTVKNPTS